MNNHRTESTGRVVWVDQESKRKAKWWANRAWRSWESKQYHKEQARRATTPAEREWRELRASYWERECIAAWAEHRKVRDTHNAKHYPQLYLPDEHPIYDFRLEDLKATQVTPDPVEPCWGRDRHAGRKSITVGLHIRVNGIFFDGAEEIDDTHPDYEYEKWRQEYRPSPWLEAEKLGGETQREPTQEEGTAARTGA